MKKMILAVITLMAVMINANAQNLGLGLSGQALVGTKSLSAKFNASYEMSISQIFAVEGVAYGGLQQTDTEKVFRYENGEERFFSKNAEPVFGADIYGKLNIFGFQVFGGVGYIYAHPSKMETLQPEEGWVATVSTYGRMASGFKASAGIAYSLLGSDSLIGNRLDIKLLCNFLPFNNSGQMARKLGIEFGVTYYFSLR